MLSGLSTFVATLTGKVVLGTAVAAASVGGLHAADVVDVPGLPDNDTPAVEQAGNGDVGTEAHDGEEAAEIAQAKHEAAEKFAAAIDEWTDCVSANAEAQGDETTRVEGPFDPREGDPATTDDDCGEVPDPRDPEFAPLTDPPAGPADVGSENADDNAKVPEDPGAESEGAGTQSEDGAGNADSAEEGTENDPTGESSNADDNPAF